MVQTMDVDVSFYGILSHLAGRRVRTVTVAGGAPTVGDLRRAIAGQFPALAPHMEQVAVESGAVLLADADTLEAGARISLLPPVSGGSAWPNASRAGISRPKS